MKKIIINFVLILIACFFAAPTQAQKNSRDLYLSKAEPGVKITLVLNRKGRIRNVSRRTVFQAGDKVAFKFATNFSAYVAVLTKGSSGKRKLLFPYKGAQDQMTAHENFRIPTGQQWFEFDNTPGKEELVFIMSSNPITEISNLPANNNTPAPAPPTATPAKPPAQTPAQQPPANAGKTEEDEILAALNSRALRNGRDLNLTEKDEEAYATASPQQMQAPIAIPLVLKHQ